MRFGQSLNRFLSPNTRVTRDVLSAAVSGIDIRLRGFAPWALWARLNPTLQRQPYHMLIAPPNAPPGFVRSAGALVHLLWAFSALPQRNGRCAWRDWSKKNYA